MLRTTTAYTGSLLETQKLIQHVPMSHGHSRIATTEDDTAHDAALSPYATISDENTLVEPEIVFSPCR